MLPGNTPDDGTIVLRGEHGPDLTYRYPSAAAIGYGVQVVHRRHETSQSPVGQPIGLRPELSRRETDEAGKARDKPSAWPMPGPVRPAGKNLVQKRFLHNMSEPYIARFRIRSGIRSSRSLGRRLRSLRLPREPYPVKEQRLIRIGDRKVRLDVA